MSEKEPIQLILEEGHSLTMLQKYFQRIRNHAMQKKWEKELALELPSEPEQPSKETALQKYLRAVREK